MRAEGDVDRARDVGCGKRFLPAHIEDQAVLACTFVHLLGTEPLLACHTPVGLNIPRRVDDGATAGAFVSDHVRVDGEAWNEAAVQEHGQTPA